MAIVTSYDWSSDSWTHHNGENPARKAFREAVEVVAAHAREKLPETINGRIDAAVKIVLQGDVELLPDDKAKIGSQSNGVTKYHLVDGTCDCRDFEKAPDNWCKHRIAFGIYKRATALAQAQLQALDASAGQHEEPAIAPVETPVESEQAVETTVTPVTPLPEAPASVNCHIMLEGRQVQITLRDTDETRLLTRLSILLQQYPVPQAQPQMEAPSATLPPAPPVPQPQVAVSAPDSPYCHTHHVALKQFSKDGRTWFSHKTLDGSWCKGN